MTASTLSVTSTPIPGLLVIDLPMPGDNRGWFKENWQRAKMTALGLPDFGPVQNNMSFNSSRGATRGLHAEPWDKFVSVAHGRILGAWVDLREGESFGTVFTVEMGPEKAVFVPRGVANGYQALADETVYTYLVNEHWSPEARASYTYLNLADETANIAWPIPLADAEISAADLAHPRLADVVPMPPRRTVIVGSAGQLGQALSQLYPDATLISRSTGVDATDLDALRAVDWSGVGTIINAAAYTAVDLAETEQGRRDCWAANVKAVANLVQIAREKRATLVHVSSDYVFDGTIDVHSEDEGFSPLGVYGQTKAAADAVVATLDRHYIVRTSWVIGAGNNFVKTMATLAARGVSPKVVGDQFGRLTFTDDLAAGIKFLLDSQAPTGTYNYSNSGATQSWADIAKQVFERCGRSADDVTPITTAEYSADKLVSPRPRFSTLSLDKITAAGCTPPDADESLAGYLGTLDIQV